MKKLSFLFLVFLIASLAISIGPVRANPDSTWLYVDTYNLVTEDWTTVGSTPYLSTQNQPTDYGYASANNKVWEEFTFSDLADSPTVNSVNVSVYSDVGSEKIRVFIYDSGVPGWVEADSITGSGWAWRTVDISSILTTDAEVDAAKVYFKSKGVGGWSGSVSVDCARLGVDYSAAGQEYVADLTQSVSSTWNIVTETDYNIIPSQSITTSWNVLTEWDAILDLTQSITSSWEILLSHGMFVDLSQSISSTWNVVTSHGMFVDLSQSISTTWDILIQSTFNVVSTQAISTTWDVLLQTTFNVGSSLSIVTSWIVDLARTVALTGPELGRGRTPAPSTFPSTPSGVGLILSENTKSYHQVLGVDGEYVMDLYLYNRRTTGKAVTIHYWLDNSENETVWSKTEVFSIPAGSYTILTLKYPVKAGGSYTANAQVISPEPAGEIISKTFVSESLLIRALPLGLILILVLIAIIVIDMETKKRKKRARS